MTILKSIVFVFLSIQLSVWAVDRSSPVGKDTTAGNFTASVITPFTLSDGTVVSSGRQISGLRYRSVWLGGARMTLVVNGQEKHFQVPKQVYIDRGYPMAYIRTSAASTGQGIGVQTTNQAIGVESSYETVETNTCYSEPFDVCLRRDPSVCKYNVRASGTERVLVEYSEQDYRGKVSLTDAAGRVVARLGYDTKDFDHRELDTVYYCDAEDNVRAKRREVREDLREASSINPDKPKKPRKPGKKRPRKH